ARQGVPFIKERLRPVAAVDPKQTTQLLADLDSNRFAARLKAANALEALGELAEPALRQALSNKPSLEMRQRLEGLLKELEAPISSGALRVVRAVEILELAGTVEARQLLATLAKGERTARITREAHDSLERLTKRLSPETSAPIAQEETRRTD